MRLFNCLTFIGLSLFFLVGCSGLEKSELKKRRQINLVVESIKRKASDSNFELKDPIQAENQEIYPWQKKYIGHLPKITKEFFRCKGHPSHPPLCIKSEDNQVTYQPDCDGIESHSLPIRDGREFIYPILIDLLNHVQEITGRRVVISSGHRCPTHNLYIDPSKKNRVSKHLIGAEVDFYVEGMENQADSILEILKNFYASNPLKNRGHSWLNQEVIITKHSMKEPFNGDNQHGFRYITIEVCYDKDKKKPVHFSWKLGYNGFHRNR